MPVSDLGGTGREAQTCIRRRIDMKGSTDMH